MLSRKHYALVAGAFHKALQRNNGEEEITREIKALASDMATMFREDNPRFEWSRFEQAVETGKGAKL